jgi:GDP-L-fucose synthase
MSVETWPGTRVLVTGASGFVGRHLVGRLRGAGAVVMTPTRAECDLLVQEQVRTMLSALRPHVVIHAAGLVGGILANKLRPAEFCYENLLMGTLLLHESHAAGVRKYVALIGGCSYPQSAPNPIRESELWNGYPQPESAPYSLAKAMSVVQAQAYRTQHGFDAIVLVPGNLYGPGDNFDLTSSHVIPALIRKFHEAERAGQDEVTAWGTGTPVRDFIYVEDAAEGILVGASRYSGPEIVNISSGVPVTIRELAETIADLVGFRGRIRWDTSKPDGQRLKAFDVTRMREWLGYQPSTPLRAGLQRTISWFLEHETAPAQT